MNLNALSHVCLRLPEALKHKENFTDEVIYKIIESVAFRYNETIVDWRDNSWHEDGNVVSVLTEEGICFAYNTLNSHDIYTDE